MLDMTKVLNLQGQLFLLLAAGFFFRKKILDERFQKGLTDLIIDLLLPCNIIVSFQVEMNRELLKSSVYILGISFFNQVICILLGALLFRWCREDDQPSLKYATLCSNAGFLGMPIAEGLWGAEGTMLASMFLIPQRVFMWTAGVGYYSRDKRNVFVRLITHPCIVAVIIGLIIMAFQIRFPAFLDKAIHSFSNCNTGMSMFLIGMIASKIRLRDFLDKEILWFCAVRLALIPLITFAFSKLIGADPLSAGMSTILVAMPAGGTTAVLAAKYGRNPEFAVGCVATSTLLSLIAIPIWSMFV